MRRRACKSNKPTIKMFAALNGEQFEVSGEIHGTREDIERMSYAMICTVAYEIECEVEDLLAAFSHMKFSKKDMTIGSADDGGEP